MEVAAPRDVAVAQAHGTARIEEHADVNAAASGENAANDPSSFQAAGTRRAIVIAYWAVILLCVPYWWISTTIERHSLPLDGIAQWQQRGICPVRLPVGIVLSQEASPRLRSTFESLNSLTTSTDKCLDFRIADRTDAYSIFIEEQGQATRGVQLSSTRSGVAHMLIVPSGTTNAETLLRAFVPAASRNTRAVQYASKYKLVFSLLNEDIAKGGYTEWPVTSALKQSIYPLLRALRHLHKFDVETQILYYARMAVQRTLTEEGAVIEEDQLKAFINSAEWNLASAVSTDPVLHFIVYVPAKDKSPLLIRRSDGELVPLVAFLSPQWGGVYVQSPTSPDLTIQNLSAPFKTFATQIRTLLDVPTLSLPSMSTGVDESSGQAGWAINALMRERTVQNAKESVERLAAISRQVHEIQNMRIPLAVQRDVQGALDALARIETPDLVQAMNQSSIALDLAKRASFNHEMLAMLYFPDEHKWAVYTPLFGPIAVPLLVALIREIKEWQRNRKESKQKKKLE